MLARLVHSINAYSPAAIGIDIVMPESDPLSPERVLAQLGMDPLLLEQIAALPSNDAELASAFSVAPIVVVLAGAPGPSAAPIRVRRCSSAMPPDSRVRPNARKTT